MSKTITWALAACAGTYLAIAFIGFVATANEETTAADCDKMGRTMLNGEPYLCVRMSEGAR